MAVKVAVAKEKCSGCRICQVVCSLEKSGRVAPRSARMAVVSRARDAVDEPRICRQCPDAPCVEACPSQALVRGSGGGDGSGGGWLALDAEGCTRCGACVEACPFGALRSDRTTGLPLVCDGCEGRFVCAAHCPTGAIAVGEG